MNPFRRNAAGISLEITSQLDPTYVQSLLTSWAQEHREAARTEDKQRVERNVRNGGGSPGQRAILARQDRRAKRAAG